MDDEASLVQLSSPGGRPTSQDHHAPPTTPTYRYSLMSHDGHSPGDDAGGGRLSHVIGRHSSPPHPRRSDLGGRPSSSAGNEQVFVRGSILDRDIAAAAISTTAKPERIRDYKGRLRIWPGVLITMLILGSAGFLITYYGIRAHDSSTARAKDFEDREFRASKIKGGNENQTDADLVSDDGIIGNPKKYPASSCELPNYLSKNGHIVAVAANGTEVHLKIKGVNWFGMETKEGIPLGLWENDQNGTTAYQIMTFLSRNKFNAVRLPLMAQWILENKVPNKDLINRQESRAISTKDYMSLLKGVIKALQFRNIGVMISMHTLTPEDKGDLWYNKKVSQDDFLKAIGILTKNLCSKEYWNIIGIDLKNEPAKATWGDGSPSDFRDGAKTIANHMLEGCSNWLGFVEGVYDKHKVTIDGKQFEYSDWFGGGLQGVKKAGLEFSIKDKLVWAPHYYTPAVYPQKYFYGGENLSAADAIANYVELDDQTLRSRIKGTIDDMFGFLASETGPALLLGEFGGLYATDKHPLKTTKRCTDFTIEIIKRPGWAGGFVWSLNPESEYQYNPADTPGQFAEGLLTADWLNANEEYVRGMKAMDDMDNLVPFPCFSL